MNQKILYDEQGRIKEIANYQDALLHGMRYLFSNGKLVIMMEYIKNLQHGVMYSFDDHGLIVLKAEYLAGVKNGLEVIFNMGRIIKIQAYVSNKLNGPYFLYDKNGFLCEKGFYDNGVQVEQKQLYDIAGKQVLEEYYIHGIKV